MTHLPQPQSEANATASADRPLRIGVVRFSAAQFLGALVLFFIAAPLVEKLPNGSFIDGTLLTLVLATGVLAVGRHRKNLILAAVVVAPAIVCRWVHHFWPDLVSTEIFLSTGLMAVAFVFGNLLHFVLRAPRVNSEVLCAGISAYFLLGLLWAFGYLLVAGLTPGSFAFSTGAPASRALGNFDAFYFSFVTLSTVGYGDITPVSNGARMLAMMEAMTGTLYVAVFIARLVALYSSRELRDATVGVRRQIQADNNPSTMSNQPSTIHEPRL